MAAEDLVVGGILIFMSWMWYRADKKATDWQRVYRKSSDNYDNLNAQYERLDALYESQKSMSSDWEGQARKRNQDVEALYTTIATMEATAKLHADPDKEKRIH